MNEEIKYLYSVPCSQYGARGLGEKQLELMLEKVCINFSQKLFNRIFYN